MENKATLFTNYFCFRKCAYFFFSTKDMYLHLSMPWA